jgi:hypothetical protein
LRSSEEEHFEGEECSIVEDKQAEAGLMVEGLSVSMVRMVE